MDLIMNVKQKVNVVNVISSSGEGGIGILLLIRDTGVTRNDLSRFIAANTNYFSPIGDESKYTLNNTGPFKGSRIDIITDLYSKEPRLRGDDFYLYILMAFVIGYSLGGL